MDTVIVNGVEYVRKDTTGEIKIVVLERGFVYVGRYHEDGDQITITNARCLVRWGTTKHLGELVNGPLTNTKLGAPCTVRARVAQVIHTIEVNQNDWND